MKQTNRIAAAEYKGVYNVTHTPNIMGTIDGGMIHSLESPTFGARTFKNSIRLSTGNVGHSTGSRLLCDNAP